MSSVLSAYARVDKPPTKFFSLITPSYEDTQLVSGQTIQLPIPFTVVNQVLDINVNQSDDIQTFVNDGTTPEDYSDLQAKAFGGASLIESFGPNMTTYLRNLIKGEESLGAAYTGPIVIYVRPVMTKVQMADPVFGQSGGVFVRDGSWGFTTQPPASAEYTGGGSANNFFTAWVFKTPITIKYEVTGGYKYLTMSTQFSEQ